MMGAVASIAHDLDPELPLADARTMGGRVADFHAGDGFGAVLLAAFAAVALVLATVGIYGVVAYSVTRRGHESSVRIALGARPRDIFSLVVGQGLRLAVVGVAIGLAASLAVGRLLESLLFGVSATDPVTLVTITLLLTAVALAACLTPARRATKVDPIVALRSA